MPPNKLLLSAVLLYLRDSRTPMTSAPTALHCACMHACACLCRSLNPSTPNRTSTETGRKYTGRQPVNTICYVAFQAFGEGFWAGGTPKSNKRSSRKQRILLSGERLARLHKAPSRNRESASFSSSPPLFAGGALPPPLRRRSALSPRFGRSSSPSLASTYRYVATLKPIRPNLASWPCSLPLFMFRAPPPGSFDFLSMTPRVHLYLEKIVGRSVSLFLFERVDMLFGGDCKCGGGARYVKSNKLINRKTGNNFPQNEPPFALVAGCLRDCQERSPER